MPAFAGNLCDILGGSLRELFRCSQEGDLTKISTPYLYPDGDIIDLFVKLSSDDGVGIVSDLGETVRWLRSQTITAKRSPRQTAMIQDICMTHGVEFFKGMIRQRFHNERELADVAARVTEASIRISDLWLTFRNRSIESVSQEVEEFLKIKEIPFEKSPQLVGRSGRIWTPAFQTSTSRKSSLVYILSTGSKSAARSISEHVLAGWFDLSHYKVGPQPAAFVSLFDDTADVWSEQDFNLVRPLSKSRDGRSQKNLLRYLMQQLKRACGHFSKVCRYASIAPNAYQTKAFDHSPILDDFRAKIDPFREIRIIPTFTSSRRNADLWQKLISST